MQKKLILLAIIFFTNTTIIFAHDAHADGPEQHFTLANNKKIHGYFLMVKNNEVYIQNHHHAVKHYSMQSFSEAQQQFFVDKYLKIVAQNAPIVSANNVVQVVEKINRFNYFILLQIAMAGLFLFFGFQFYKNYLNASKLKYVYTVLMLGVSIALMSGDKLTRSTTDPLVVDKAFAPFVPNVATRWDADWFYVESKSIPTTHGMMVGIASNGWQQQVPIPHCYVGNNAWQVPLNPIVASAPVAVNANHFTVGAIAIAVNGVPIFNPFTVSGQDAFLTGQLDNFGGHCGRGDDYHYHTAPTHLYTTTSDTLPIAYALDGYAVRGTKEHDGTAMATLDANHGHSYGGVYHYHGSAGAPYMIGNMVGVVTETNKQILPQPQGQPVRTENWTPLNGALITSCVPNATANGYTLTYTLNGVSGYAIEYSWSGTVYTFNYTTPNGTTFKTYNGPNLAQCNLSTAIAEITSVENQIQVFPNPATNILQINLGKNLHANTVSKMAIVNMQGAVVYSTTTFINKINIENLAKGNYVLLMQIGNTQISKKICKN